MITIRFFNKDYLAVGRKIGNLKILEVGEYEVMALDEETGQINVYDSNTGELVDNPNPYFNLFNISVCYSSEDYEKINDYLLPGDVFRVTLDSEEQSPSFICIFQGVFIPPYSADRGFEFTFTLNFKISPRYYRVKEGGLLSMELVHQKLGSIPLSDEDNITIDLIKNPSVKETLTYEYTYKILPT